VGLRSGDVKRPTGSRDRPPGGSPARFRGGIFPGPLKEYTLMPVCTGKHKFEEKKNPPPSLSDVWEVFVDLKWFFPNPDPAPDPVLKPDQVDNEKLLA
jgi:hypothetical protein